MDCRMSKGSKPDTTTGLPAFFGDPVVRTAANHRGYVPGANKAIQAHVRRIQDRPDSGDNGDMIAKHGKIRQTLGFRAHEGQSSRRRRRFKSYGEKDDVLA